MLAVLKHKLETPHSSFQEILQRQSDDKYYLFQFLQSEFLLWMTPEEFNSSIQDLSQKISQV